MKAKEVLVLKDWEIERCRKQRNNCNRQGKKILALCISVAASVCLIYSIGLKDAWVFFDAIILAMLANAVKNADFEI